MLKLIYSLYNTTHHTHLSSIGTLQLPTTMVVVALVEVAVIPPNEEGETQRLHLRGAEGGETLPLLGYAVEQVTSLCDGED
jgi:hypothetical protein